VFGVAPKSCLLAMLKNDQGQNSGAVRTGISNYIPEIFLKLRKIFCTIKFSGNLNPHSGLCPNAVRA
jgi:hypothetical protein